MGQIVTKPAAEAVTTDHTVASVGRTFCTLQGCGLWWPELVSRPGLDWLCTRLQTRLGCCGICRLMRWSEGPGTLSPEGRLATAPGHVALA